MKLHESLADLARDHGHDLFRDAAAFRGSLDDYLDEGQASSGTINLLTDAVRLGALDGMLTMLDSGANPADAVESAGQRLARDRGSADVRGCQWAVAVLGFALGKVPETLVTGLDPEAGTTAPPSHGPGGTAPTPPPMQSPVAPPQQPIMSPPHQPSSPTNVVHQQSGGAGWSNPTPSYAAGGWSQPTPPQKKSNTGLIIAAAVVALVVVVGGIIGLVLANGGDDDPSANDDPSASSSESGSTDNPSESSSEEPSDDVADLGGPKIEGLGYQVSVPTGWTDGTAEFTAQNPGLSTLDKVFLWGSTFNTARGNVIVETQSAYGYTDPNDLKENWKKALVSSDASADIQDIANVSIDGQTALGVEIARTNEGGVEVHQVSRLVISGDKGYSITVSYKKGDEDVRTKFEEILSVWQWTS
ncbi:MAG: hypothetical protein NTX33_19110 [Propionibacteriales bacterium]|nr:hypothetical protein [Propionibacteriales bacterium]